MFWITGLLGLALIVAPWLLGFASTAVATWVSVVIGAVVLIASLVGVSLADEKVRTLDYWVLALAGLVAAFAPFVFGYTALTAALWTSLIIGVVLVLWDGYKLIAPRQ